MSLVDATTLRRIAVAFQGVDDVNSVQRPIAAGLDDVTFSESVGSFFDPMGFQLVDEKHSFGEKRFYWIGKTSTKRILTTRFTRRGTKIRIIGCAEWRKFRRLYHETTKTK